MEKTNTLCFEENENECSYSSNSDTEDKSGKEKKHRDSLRNEDLALTNDALNNKDVIVPNTSFVEDEH